MCSGFDEGRPSEHADLLHGLWLTRSPHWKPQHWPWEYFSLTPSHLLLCVCEFIDDDDDDDSVFVGAGVLIYVFYSIPNSVLGQRAKKLEEFPIRDNTKI